MLTIVLVTAWSVFPSWIKRLFESKFSISNCVGKANSTYFHRSHKWQDVQKSKVAQGIDLKLQIQWGICANSLLHIHSFGFAGGKLNKSQKFIPNVVIGKISLLMIATQTMWCIRRSFKRPKSAMKFCFRRRMFIQQSPGMTMCLAIAVLSFIFSISAITTCQCFPSKVVCTVHHDAAIVMNPIRTHNSDVYKVLLKKEGMEKWLAA